MTTRNVVAHQTDHLAIRSLLDRYTDALNRRDWAAVESVFAPDGVWDAGGPQMPAMAARFEGAQGCAQGIAGLVTPLELCVQSNHAPHIEVSGDQATATSTINEFVIPPGSPGPNIVWGMYFDRIVRGPDGEWRFKERKFRFFWVGTPGGEGQLIARVPQP